MECIIRKSKFFNPSKDFQEDIYIIEHRRDPLTGTMSIFGKNMEDKVKILFGEPDQESYSKGIPRKSSKMFYVS